jgi:hypothetical protein
MKKDQERELTKKVNQKKLLEKFGFSDEEDERKMNKAIEN